MKNFKKIVVFMLIVCLALTMVACGSKDKPVLPPDDLEQPDKPVEPDKPIDPVPPVEQMITSADVVNARNAVENLSTNNYDFKLNFSCTPTIAGVSKTMNANYDAQYRLDKSTNNYKFHRTTSGILLYDSNEYINSVNDNKTKIIFNDKNELKRTSVLLDEEAELDLINKPFESIVNSLEATNLTDLKKSNSNYDYQAKIKFSSDNRVIQTALNAVGKLGTSISIKNIDFTNIADSIEIYFNIKEENGTKYLYDFKFGIDFNFTFKGVTVIMQLTYSQQSNNADITIPKTEGLITDKIEVQEELNVINNAIQNVKNSETYSVDMTATNDFDPGVTTMATVDKYIARLYKNTKTVDGVKRVDFNHSYEYKTHTEDAGKETYKFTYGNTTEEGKVYQIKRKGSNQTLEAPNVTVDTQFDYLLAIINYSSNEIDCIKKELNDKGETVYKLFMNSTTAKDVMNRILGYVNSNNEPGVIDVDNLFDNESSDIKDAELTITIKGDKLVSAQCNTTIKYFPLSGEFKEDRVTLKNEILIEIDKKLTDAQKYNAPKKPDGTLSNLSYIL